MANTLVSYILCSIIILVIAFPIFLYLLAVRVKETVQGRQVVAFVLALIVISMGVLILSSSSGSHVMGSSLIGLGVALLGVSFGFIQDNPTRERSPLLKQIIWLGLTVVIFLVINQLTSSNSENAGSINQDGISITFSKSWYAMEFNPEFCSQPNLTCIAGAGVEKNEFEFVVLRFSPPPLFPSLDATESATQFVREITANLPESQEISSENLKIDGHNAIHKVLQLPPSNLSTKPLIVEVFFIQDGDTVILLRIQGTSERVEQYQTDIDQTITSFRFVN